MRAPVLLGSILIAAAFLPTPSTTQSIDTAEVGRIQAHIARAEVFAGHRDLSRLTPAQRAARARELARLAAYRRHGEFPENRVRTGRTPVFVDPRGVHCAVGHLLALDGEVALVAHIVATRNCARVRELADEPRLVAWLDRNGLTLEEAARIQPSYGPDVPFGDVVLDERHDYPYQAAATVSGFVSLTGILANLDRGGTPASRTARVVYGSVVGATGIGIGAAGYSRDEPGFATVSLLAGTLAVASTLHNLAWRPTDRRSLVSWTPRWQGGSRVAFVSAVF